MKKSTLIGICTASAVFIALLLVATFYDLQISVALGNGDSLFGQFFRLWGEVTGWIVIPICAAILLRACDKKTKAGKIITAVWAIVLVVGWYFTITYFIEEFTGDSYIEGMYGSPYGYLPLHSAVFALMVSGLHVWGIYKVKEETVRKLVFFAVVMLIALALSQLITTIMKDIWTRQRFRNLDIGNGGTSSDGFTPWYEPGLGKNKEAATYYVEDSIGGMLKKDAYKSFPSGHTSAAALTFGLVMLPEIFEKLKKYKIWFWIAPFVYTVLVGISRIVNRAHYFSDTLFGGAIGTLSVFASIAIVKLFKKNEKKNKFFAAAAKLLGAESATEISEESVSVPEEETVEADSESVLDKAEISESEEKRVTVTDTAAGDIKNSDE